MSKNAELTPEEAADVFNQMANTFDAQNGQAAPASTAPVVEKEEEKTKEVVAPAAAAPQVNSDEFDFDSLPQGAQKKLKYYEQYQKSNEGRVAALQRQLDEQRQQLSKLQEGGLGNSNQAKALEKSIEDNEIDLEGLDQDIPELGKLVNAVKSIKQDLNSVRNTVQKDVMEPMREQQARESQDREARTLAEMHPDYEDIQRDKNFWDWVDSQHPTIQKLADTNHAGDAAYLIDLFKKTNPQTNSFNNSSNPPDKKIERNVDDLMSLPNEGNARSGGIDGNEQTLWSHYASLADSGKL
jgi:chromosome segregation ATPase